VIETDIPHARRRRPRAVTFVGWLLCGEALLLLSVGGINLLSQVWTQGADLNAIGSIVQAGTDLIQVRIPVLNTLLGSALLVAGIGLLRMRHWAWLLAMTIEAVSLATALYLYAHGEQHFGAMALSSLIVLALNQREVRQAFIHNHDAPD
jgi:hypothetical protein